MAKEFLRRVKSLVFSRSEKPPGLEKGIVSPFSEPSRPLSPSERDRQAKRLLTIAEEKIKRFPELNQAEQWEGGRSFDVERGNVYFHILYYPNQKIYLVKNTVEEDESVHFA